MRRKAATPPAPKKKTPKKPAAPRRRRVRRTTESDRLYARAKEKMPGGVSSPVRSFKSVGATPFFVKKAKGSTLVDADGNRYVDYVMSYGPHLFGHMPKAVASAIRKALPRGTSYGAPCRAEVELAERVSRLVPSIAKVRFVSSGTEAAMSAVRLARAVTGRDLVLKFAGCYHGHADSFLVAAGSGVATLGIPGSPGVPADLAKATLTARYNDLESVEALFRKYPGQIAAIAVEPVAANMGVVLPKPGFLEGLRKIADREEAILLFDEVITGFRLARGGAQEVFGVKPDLTCLGKILGGGLPVGAYGGRADLMAHVAPDGPVYQAGTLSGNPLAMAAGIAMLDSLTPAVYAKLEKTSAKLEKGMRKVAQDLGFADRLTLSRIGSILTLFFNPGPIADFDDVKKSDGPAFTRWFHGLLKRGVFIAPAPFEAMFVSTAHTDKDLERTLAAHREALKETFAGG
ncbi:MAG: glutamate-1-semialdehyde 2,1-aminomutase [Deltaproteobacteria bacterium]|nr:glutamate-1-semialdehyde 2,1-aminomutase [Deltaproteobacteria bacterium]